MPPSGIMMVMGVDAMMTAALNEPDAAGGPWTDPGRAGRLRGSLPVQVTGVRVVVGRTFRTDRVLLNRLKLKSRRKYQTLLKTSNIKPPSLFQLLNPSSEGITTRGTFAIGNSGE